MTTNRPISSMMCRFICPMCLCDCAMYDSICARHIYILLLSLSLFHVCLCLAHSRSRCTYVCMTVCMCVCEWVCRCVCIRFLRLQILALTALYTQSKRIRVTRFSCRMLFLAFAILVTWMRFKCVLNWPSTFFPIVRQQRTERKKMCDFAFLFRQTHSFPEFGFVRTIQNLNKNINLMQPKSGLESKVLITNLSEPSSPNNCQIKRF